MSTTSSCPPGEAGAPRRLVLVLGMHRSGTSLVTDLIGRWGFELGADLLPPRADNPRGFFEHAGIVAAHDALFDGLGLSWEDAERLPYGWADCAAARTALERMSRELEALFAQSPRVAVKDPRACRFVPLWRRLAEHCSARLSIVLVLREPAQSVASLSTRDGLADEHVRLLWLLHVLDSEAATRDVPRALVTYDELLSGDNAAVARMARELDCAGEAAAGIEDVVDPSLRHHLESPRDPERTPLGMLADRVYDAIASAASGGAVDVEELERVQHELEPWLALYGGARHAVDRRWRARFEQARLEQAARDEERAAFDPAHRDWLDWRKALEFADGVVRQRMSDLEHGIFARENELRELRTRIEELSAEHGAQAERFGLERAQLGALVESLRRELAQARGEADAFASLVEDQRLALAAASESRQRALDAAVQARRALDERLRADEGTRPGKK